MVLTILSTAQQVQAALDLRGLLELATEHSPALRSAQNRLLISGLNRKNAIAGFFPSLDLTATQGYRETTPSGDDEPWGGSELRLSLTEPLYDNGRSWIAYESSGFEKGISDLELVLSREQLALDLSNAYYEFVLASLLYRVKQFQNDLLGKQFKSIEFAHRQGLRSRDDYLRFKARLKRSDLDVKAAANAIVQSRNKIYETAGVSLRDEKPPDIAVPDPDRLVEAQVPTDRPRLEHHLRHRITRLTRQKNALAVDLERKKYWPELSLEADYIYTNADYLSGRSSFVDDKTSGVSVLLSVNFNLWDWGLRARNVQIAKYEEAVLGHELDRELMELELRLRNLMADLDLFKQNFDLSAELMQLETKNYETMNEKYRNGQVSFLDIVNAVDDLVSAREAYYGNLIELKKAMMEHRFHEGEAYEFIRKN